MIKILLVEDDPIIGRSLEISLKSKKFDISWAKTLKEGYQLEETEQFDLILLDLRLPDGNGLELCESQRVKKNSKIPIIVLTANLEEESVVNSFEKGVNDYIRKPFGQAELIARIQNVLNIKKIQKEKIRFEDLLLVVEERKVYWKEVEISLNRREFDILEVLMRRSESVLTREQLFEHFTDNEDIIDRTIDSHLSRLRQKLKKANAEGIKISSVYGVGYKLESV